MNDENNKDPISESLNILPFTPIEEVKNELIPVGEDSVDADFDSVRSNIHDMIQTASDAITDLALIAKQSQNPRAFEVLAKLIETSAKANKDLIEIQEKMKNIKILDGGGTNQAPKTVNQSIFVGSTSELSKVINILKKGTGDDTKI